MTVELIGSYAYYEKGIAQPNTSISGGAAVTVDTIYHSDLAEVISLLISN